MTADEYEAVIRGLDQQVLDLKQDLSDAQEDYENAEAGRSRLEGELYATGQERDKYYNALEDIERVTRGVGI